MKLVYGKRAYDRLTPDSHARLTPVPCRCRVKSVQETGSEADPDPDCDYCMGGGVIYEDRTIHPDDMRAILDNLRSQGMPIPKDEGTQ